MFASPGFQNIKQTKNYEGGHYVKFLRQMKYYDNLI